MPIELEAKRIQLPPDLYAIFCLEWALWKAKHGQWEHCKHNIMEALPAVIAMSKEVPE